MTMKDYGSVERWGVFEWSCGGSSNGNPFVDQWLRATFTGGDETVTVDGFYDGGGVYRVRFMPSFVGEYRFHIEASFNPDAPEGRFEAVPAGEGNHGVVRVRNTYHFAYDDGTPYISLGTTCYAWAMLDDQQIEHTLDTLAGSAFNKLRFCVFPKHYAYNLYEPRSYPFEGTPMDSSVLNDENFGQYGPDAEGNRWDFDRFNPAHFRHIEDCIRRLRDLGIEADLILFHPYDRWGFSRMPREVDLRYIRYAAARFAAYRNVWWSLANEYDIMTHKTPADWEAIAEALCGADPCAHLRSIHNCLHLYDFSRPWVTHCSIQRTNLYLSAEMTDEWRVRWRKPVVIDEMAYEGDIPYGWGSLTGEEMTRRFWETALRGGYPGHGETLLHPDGRLWWSHGGELRGESPARIALLAKVLSAVPGGALRLSPRHEWDEVCAVPDTPGGEDMLYLYYYSFMRPSYRDFNVNGRYRVTVIDTWNMTTEALGVREGRFRVDLPARPYMAVMLERV